MPKRAYAALGKYLDYLIGQGRIGVRHSVYDFLVTDRKVADTYKIRLPGGISFSADPPEGSFVGNRGTAVAEPLKLALKLLGATPTNSRGGYWAD